MDVDASPAAVLLAGFRSWLVAERGLSAETVRCYCFSRARSWGRFRNRWIRLCGSWIRVE
jgi:hypothetical protein